MEMMKLEDTRILQFKMAWEQGRIFSPGEFFKNQAPLELEIGCGKGKFLVARAQESPERNFIGIDRAGKWMKIGDRRGSRRNLENLVFIKTEALEFFENLAPLSVAIFHMYFPDPWPKRRHHRRRLFSAAFLKMLETKLKAGGFIELATDHLDYYQKMQEAVEAAAIVWAGRRETVNERLHSPHLKTNYELKFEAAGKKLYYMELQK